MTARAPVRGVLFDKDGTLFDFAKSWNRWTQALILDMSRDVPDGAEAVAQALGFDLHAGAFRPDSFVIAGTLDDAADALAPILPGHDRATLAHDLARRAENAPMVPAADLSALLGNLAERGLALGVATNDAEAPARAHLKHAGIVEHFAFVAGADSGFGAKPDPGMCRAFAQATGLAPDAVVMVGDSLFDLQAGRAAGMQTLGVLTGPADAAELAPHADAILPDIGALPAWLDAQLSEPALRRPKTT